MISQLGTSVVYDVQVLPYFPYSPDDAAMCLHNRIDFTGVDTSRLINIVDSNNNIKSFVYFPMVSKFSLELDYVDRDLYNTSNTKVYNETTFYRLQAPNFASSFEYSPAKNNMNPQQAFICDCVYKPYTPYIHITPIWNGLYSNYKDFDYSWDDARGLICHGDYSIDLVDNAWTQYKLANKNYEEIFNRDIKSLDLAQNITRSGYALSGINSVINSAMGLNIMGIVQGAGNTIANGLMGEKQMADTRSAMIDKFNYQLGNIQAQPQTVTKVSALTQQYQVFPVIEKYTCTDVEKQALRSYIKYCGMTVNVLSDLGINEYISPTEETFIRARLIRIPNMDEDTHMLISINNELQQGAYYPAKGV